MQKNRRFNTSLQSQSNYKSKRESNVHETKRFSDSPCTNLKKRRILLRGWIKCSTIQKLREKSNKLQQFFMNASVIWSPASFKHNTSIFFILTVDSSFLLHRPRVTLFIIFLYCIIGVVRYFSRLDVYSPRLLWISLWTKPISWSKYLSDAEIDCNCDCVNGERVSSSASSGER